MPGLGVSIGIPTSHGRLRATDVPQSEANALINLYAQTGGGAWTFKDNWLKTPAVGDWDGVLVASAHVRTLDLHQNGMAGQVDWVALLAGLPYLEELTFTDNPGLSGDMVGMVMPNCLRTFLVGMTDTGTTGGDISCSGLFTVSTGIQSMSFRECQLSLVDCRYILQSCVAVAPTATYEWPTVDLWVTGVYPSDDEGAYTAWDTLSNGVPYSWVLSSWD